MQIFLSLVQQHNPKMVEVANLLVKRTLEALAINRTLLDLKFQTSL